MADKSEDRKIEDNKREISKLQADVGSLQTSLAQFTKSFNQTVKGINGQIKNINTKVLQNSNVIRKNQEGINKSLASVQTSIATNKNNLLNYKQDFDARYTAQESVAKENQKSILSISQMVKKDSQKDLKAAQTRDRNVRLAASQKRKEIREGILEGAINSAKSTGQKLASTTSAMLGGFNLLNILKSLLGSLALGLAVTNWDSIFSFMEEHSEKFKRLFALWTKKFLRPIGRFFAAIVDLAFNIVRWTFKGINLIRQFLGKVIDFSFTLGEKIVDGVKTFVDKLIKWARKGLEALGLLKPRVPSTDVPGNKGNKGNVSPDAPDSPGGRGSGSGSSVKGTGATAGGQTDDVAQATKPWWRRGMDAIGNGAKWVGGKAYEGLDWVTGGFTTKAKDEVKKLIKKAGSILSPMVSSGKSFMSNISKAITKQDPKAFMDAAQNLWGSTQSFVKKSAGRLDDLLAPVVALMRTVGPDGVKWVQNAFRGMALNFPVDYLINHYLLEQDPFQAAFRALGSSLGSIAGVAATGASGGLLGFLGGTTGAEAGDLLFGAIGRAFGENWDTSGNLLNFIPGMEWLTDYLVGLSPLAVENQETSSTDLGTDVSSKMMAIPPNTSSLNQTLGSAPNGSGKITTGRLAGHSENPDDNLQVDIKSTETESSKSSLTSYLRNGNATGISPSNTSSNGGASVSNITLPATSVDLSPQGDGSQSRISQKEANPIPSIPSGNTAMSFYETAAAKVFEVQLV